MRIRLALITTALLALSATAAVAQYPGGGMGGGRLGGPGMRMQALLNGITLTAQQQTSIDSIQDAYRPRIRALFTQGGPPDSASRASMAALRSSQDRDIRAVLTPDQQKIWDKNMAALPPMGAGRRGPPGGQ